MPSRNALDAGVHPPDTENAQARHTLLQPPSPTAPARFRPCIATMSLGHPAKHNLVAKLTAVSTAGFEGVELYWDDLAAFATATLGDTGPQSVRCASGVLRLVCDGLGLEVVSLQPFRDFDGLEEGRQKEARLAEFGVWLSCAGALGARMIGVPASIEGEGRHPGRVVRDLETLADMAARSDPPVTVAYEGLCFSAFNSTWQRAWDAVLTAGRHRDNVGIVLDTFNISGSIWSDPLREGGLRPDRQAMLEQCLREMPAAVDRRRVALVQVADGELAGPVRGGHALHAGMRQACLRNWSRSCRLFPMEEELGAHMPVVELLRAITGRGGVGYEGWVSMEVFSRSTEGGEGCVERHARRAWGSWLRLSAALGWE